LIAQRIQLSEISDTLTIKGDKAGYADPDNVYNKLGYWAGESYEFGIVFVLTNGRGNTPVLPIRGFDNYEDELSGLGYSGDIVIPMELRADITAGTATAGQEVVTEQKLAILEPLRASLVSVQAGATFLTGLIGDVSIPTYGGTSALWKGEVAAAEDGAGAFSEVTLSPKRLTAYIDISKQFLIKDSAAAEAMLMNDIINAVSGKLEATIFASK